ncbi:Hypothetical protein A7982_02027 [Minicystis rosea]|nr:Hypothetical protein A7982_02027 [Minicystis rosea]
MSLTLYFHPLSSFCHKVLIALYENETPFERRVVDLMDPADRAAFLKIWPMGKFPVLTDTEGDRVIPESSIIIEYLAQHRPGRTALVPSNPDVARQMRLRDRFYDLYVHEPMQKIVTDKLRPAGQNDGFGVARAKERIAAAYDMIEADMATKVWTMGDAFTMADCAAAPALFYADKVVPIGETHPNVAAYLERLKKRPSYARALEEAAPFFALMPK